MSTCCLSLINDGAGTPYDLNESRSDIENNEANASTDAIHSQQGEQTCITIPSKEPDPHHCVVDMGRQIPDPP